MTGVCSMCGAVGPVHRHHVTGRPAPGVAYFDGGLVVVLCPGCHASLHQALRVAGVDFPGAEHMYLRHRLLRVGCTAELMADTGRPLVLASTSARSLAVLVREGADALDREAVGL